MPTHTLVVPFLTEDPTFVYGVEFGLLYGRMQSEAKKIEDYFCRENQERILLLANRLGWAVRRIRPWGKGWFWCRMEKQWPPQPGVPDGGG
jgi:hypothetical protein